MMLAQRANAGVKARATSTISRKRGSVLTLCTFGGLFWPKDESLEKADCLQVNLKVSWPDHE
jgi:hypothetical protein